MLWYLKKSRKFSKVRKRQMGQSYAKGSMESQHISPHGKKFHIIPVVVWSRSSITVRNQALKFANSNRGPPCPTKAKDKDLLELDSLKAVANLQKYQDETRAWRDPKAKQREFNIGNLVLLQNPCTESSGKLESK
jgi:hypothetical protein